MPILNEFRTGLYNKAMALRTSFCRHTASQTGTSHVACSKLRPRALRARSAPVASPLLDDPALDVFEQLSQLADATVSTTVSSTPLGRGLVATRDVESRQPVVSVPIQNALVIADDPVGGISIFSDRQHRTWQQVHGEIPPLLLEFLQGEARWDVRMAAWLLWMVKHPSPLWTSYLARLPSEQAMSCLLNYNRDEILELQVPALQAEAVVQADWCAYLHGSFLHCVSGSLAPLKLSSSLPTSLWAISMVRSRTFSEDVGGESLTLMVPYADLANHSFTHNATFCLAKDSCSFQLQTIQPVCAGQEVTISYGAIKPNAELLRDYGFIVPGNPCDRVKFTSSSTSSSTGSTGSTSSTSTTSSLDDLEGLPGLNPVSLLEAVGFTGDLTTGEIEPAAVPPADQHEQLRLARRKAVLLSMPLNAPQAAASGRGGGSSSSSGGGLFGWLDAATQPWTPTGQPKPEPLKNKQVAAERAAVQQLQDLLVQQLARLPTSAAADEELLLQAEQQASGSGSSSRETSSQGSSRPGGCTNPPNTSVVLPAGGLGLDTLDRATSSALWKVQRAAAGTKQQQQQQQQQRRRRRQQGSSSQAAGTAPAAAVFSTRFLMAVRARLEHKLLLREAVGVLMLYDKYLATHYG